MAYTYFRLWLYRMGFLQQEELRFSGKVAKQSNVNNFKNKSLNVHTVNEGETWSVNISNRRRYLRLQLVYKIVNDYHCPRQLQGYFALRSELRRKALRDSRELHLPRYKTAMGQSTFEYAAAKEWNDLPKELHACETLRILKIKTFKLLTESDKAQHKCSV